MWVLFDVASKGAGALASASWWSDSQRGVMPTTAAGGAAHAMVGTFVQASITSLISIPIGVFTVIYRVEYAGTGRLGKTTTFMVDILSGVPSIVAALFIYSAWIVLFGFQRAGLSPGK